MQQITSGDGYLQFAATETLTERTVGLATGRPDLTRNTLNFGITLAGGSTIAEVRENGVYKTDTPYASGDVFKVSAESGVVKYYKNNTQFYSSLTAPGYPLVAVGDLSSANSTVTNAQTSGASSPVSWVGRLNSSVLLRSCDTCYTGGAISAQQITSGDGYVQFSAIETNKERTAGLTAGRPDLTRNTINFGITLSNSATAEVRENGVYKTDTPYVTGDSFKVSVVSGVVKYYKNSNLFYTSATVPTYPLVADAVVPGPAETIQNAQLSGSDVGWNGLINAAIVLQKTSGGSGDGSGGALSKEQILVGDGYLEFAAIETNTNRAAGLAAPNSAFTIGAIKFGIKLTSAGHAEVWESGTMKTYTTYVSGDVFRTGISNGVVKYYKNGSNFYTSVTAPTYPLVADADLDSLNSTISNARLLGAQ